MTRPKNYIPKKRERPKISIQKMNAFRLEFDQILKKSKESSKITPFPLIIIASYLNRLHFKEIINSRVRWDRDQWKFSPGVLAQLMIIAAFIPAIKKIALSRIGEAYSGMDLEVLVGEPINPEELTDDLFAPMLDRIEEAGCQSILCSVALTVRAIFNLPPNYILHSDTSSHVLYGDYEPPECTPDPSCILPTYGHSKDKRNDLKQIMTGMVTDGDGLIRFSQVLNGNTADCEYNRMMIQTLYEIYGDEFYKYVYIADSKLLNKKILLDILSIEKPVKIISRIPESFSNKLANKIRILAYMGQEWQPLGICCEHPAGKGKEPEYWAQTFQRHVFGVNMWIHIYKSSDVEHRLQAKIKKACEEYESDLKVLEEKTFACEPDARSEIDSFIKSHSKSLFKVNLSIVKSINEKNQVGRPSKTPKPKKIEVTWKITSDQILEIKEMIEQLHQKEESFCLLTNIDPDLLGSRDILLLYKGQRKVEQNFSILKMPLLASTIFLEKPERIEAMMTLMYFSVLIHGILQVISRIRIAACDEPPRLGPENRPLIRPRSDTMLSILALFELVSDGDRLSIRCKMKERMSQVNLILHIVDFDPTSF